MFFSPEILARRDSGMGLLWLAATLGSKSTFKKLPKHSVMNADISQLCDQIVEPPEPLALRLSSNLMVGAARIYKVKQEFFLTDVTACFNALKKMVQEFHSRSALDLQMAQTSTRPSTLTLDVDPRAAFIADFDAMVADWDEYLNIGTKSKPTINDGESDEFVPEPKPTKKRSKPNSLPENLRADLYTLKENHDHLLPASFDASFSGHNGIDFSSSQMEGGFGYHEDLFGATDVFDISGGLGDELARELGEGWGSRLDDNNGLMDIDAPLDLALVEPGGEMDLNFDLSVNAGHGIGDVPTDSLAALDPLQKPYRSRNQHVSGSDKENSPLSLRAPLDIPQSPVVPENIFQSLPLQGFEPRVEFIAPDTELDKLPSNRIKRRRLLLDARTELTDDELRVARAQYLNEQTVLRREINMKKHEKESIRIIDNMIWGIPNGIQAQVLVDFWLENLKIQVEARSGAIHVFARNEPPVKRRKVARQQPFDENEENAIVTAPPYFDNYIDTAMDVGMEMMDDNFYNAGTMDQEPGHLPSSEDPGQGRRASRPPSALGSNLGFDVGTQNVLDDSQRSSLFPWDNAGVSSSVIGVTVGPPSEGNGRASVGRAELKLRSLDSPFSRQESSYTASQMGSATRKTGFSPMAFGSQAQLVGEDFTFNVPADDPAALEFQQGINLATLERNSFNFLEYAKMQYQTLPSSSAFTFEDIVPKSTSTRHVAAAAFYHCLVLATKDLIRLQQRDAYGAVAIVIV